MSNFLIKLDGAVHIDPKSYLINFQCRLGTNGNFIIYGREGTFQLFKKNEDLIAGTGYLCDINKPSFQQTLLDILESFNESKIMELKKSLLGQYIIIVKKNNFIYIFSDFLGARNVFYTDSGKIISSSFSAIENELILNKDHIDIYKIFEFIAMRPFYPAQLGNSTINKNIKWLMPYEYIKIDIENNKISFVPLEFDIINTKQNNIYQLSKKLTYLLEGVIARKEFINSRVGVSLTGGKDSRLIAAVACQIFSKTRFRIAVMGSNLDTKNDLSVARRLAKIENIPMDIYYFKERDDDDLFYKLTGGFSPIYNKTITPLIKNAYRYAIGFGGVYGSEIFELYPYNSIDDFYKKRIKLSERMLKLDTNFWNRLKESFFEQVRRIKAQYKFSFRNENDYIRLFMIFNTARYSSFIMEAFNDYGYQIEPYGTYPLIEFALQIPRELLKNNKVQIAAMGNINYRMARVISFKSFRPMLPLSFASAPYYFVGFNKHLLYYSLSRLRMYNQKKKIRSFLGGLYITNGWEENLTRRLEEKYGIDIISKKI